MKNSNWLVGCFNFQVSGLTIPPPGGIIISSGIKTTRPEEHNVLGTKGKFLLVNH
jgi:hypothetical protein